MAGGVQGPPPPRRLPVPRGVGHGDGPSPDTKRCGRHRGLERIGYLDVLMRVTRRGFLGGLGTVYGWLLAPPVWARRKLKVIVPRILRVGLVFAPMVNVVRLAPRCVVAGWYVAHVRGGVLGGPTSPAPDRSEHRAATPRRPHPESQEARHRRRR